MGYNSYFDSTIIIAVSLWRRLSNRKHDIEWGNSTSMNEKFGEKQNCLVHHQWCMAYCTHVNDYVDWQKESTRLAHNSDVIAGTTSYGPDDRATQLEHHGYLSWLWKEINWTYWSVDISIILRLHNFSEICVGLALCCVLLILDTDWFNS